MAKDKSISKAAKAERKAEKKAAKSAKLAKVENGGVTKVKSEDKREKKEKRKALAEKALNEIEGGNKKKEKIEMVEAEEDEEEDGIMSGGDEPGDTEGEISESENKTTTEPNSVGDAKRNFTRRPVGALVPFANPLADEKAAKKVFKSVKKAAGHRALKRGVKEVVKALRKSTSGSSAGTLPIGIVVLAADISPMDVISHIPVLAEEHSVPYIYVTSRAELGSAGQTKRPTSVVMVSREGMKGKKSKETQTDKEDGEGWDETYKGLVKLVEREGRHVKV